VNDDLKSREFGRMLRRRRVMIPLTLRELAFQSGVSPSYLGRIERGERFPSANTLRKIAKPLVSNINDLFILAGYLPPQPDVVSGSSPGNHSNGLDPYVSHMLAQEPLEIQRAAISILSIIKGVSRSINLN